MIWLMANAPEPVMPILPVGKALAKSVPVSACAPAGMLPSAHICR